MAEELFVGFIVTVGGGLVLYYGFGVGKPSKHVHTPVKEPNHARPKDSEKPSKEDSASQPTPMAIIEHVDSQTPYLKDKTEESYSGLKVKWPLTFYSLNNEDEGQVHLMLHWRQHYPWIYCDVDIETFPELKTLRRNETIQVTGTIDRVSGHEIRLKDVSLNFSLLS